MTTLVRLLAFSATLIVLVGVGYGVGSAVGPEPSESTGAMSDEPDDHRSMAATREASDVGGLAASDRGLRLELTETDAEAGMQRPLAFRVIGADGRALTAYEIEHEKPLHLIAVRRDRSGFQHVHPRMAADGTWRTTLDLTPGSWRVFADFVPAGSTDGVTLGADVSVAGAYEPEAQPAVARTTTVDDLTVTMEGAPRAGSETTLAFDVTRAGDDVQTEPYLGARGHLVVLRDGDLGYIHVHADEDLLSFEATFPTPGRYALFLEVSVDGDVRTVPFTVEVPA